MALTDISRVFVSSIEHLDPRKRSNAPFYLFLRELCGHFHFIQLSQESFYLLPGEM